MSVSEYRNNRSIRLPGESFNASTLVALFFPETIAVSVNGHGIILYDYMTLAVKTSLTTQAVTSILLNSTRLACIDSKTIIKTWSLYDHGTKAKFNGLLWGHTHDIKDIRFFKDLIVSFDNYQCFFWDWITKSCFKVVNLEIKKAVIYKNIVGIFTFKDLQIFEVSHGQISKFDQKTLSFIMRKDDQVIINLESIIITTRLNQHIYNISRAII